MRIATNRVVDVVFRAALAAAIAGCGASSTAPGTPTSASGGDAEAAAPASDGDGGSAEEERPFAGSTAEATELISVAVDKKQPDISACVREFRARTKKAPSKVVVSFGIDQEGRLLGVTSKGKVVDAELKSCVADALRGAAFPRSHAGVITVTKTYEDIVVQ